MPKTITPLTSPSLLQQPSVEFRGNDMDAAIWRRGYDIVIEDAIKCPCRIKGSNDALSSCQNCLGTGWVHVNPTQDRALLSSMNFETKYKPWTTEKLGQVSISVQHRSYLSFMDRVTVIGDEIIQSEIVKPINSGGNHFAYTIYDIKSVVEVFQFIDIDQPLRLLVQGTDYTIDRNKLILLIPAAENLSISIRYYHNPQYFIIDSPHDVRANFKTNNLGQEEKQDLPKSYVGRAVHYQIDALNFEGDNIINNSYL